MKKKDEEKRKQCENSQGAHSLLNLIKNISFNSFVRLIFITFTTTTTCLSHVCLIIYAEPFSFYFVILSFCYYSKEN
jgi:hypothetical protein